jgi:hypothetical protein
VQTKSKSRAELLFNEGSLARIGSNAIFRFKPGLRRFELPTKVSQNRLPSFETAQKNADTETVFELQNGVAVVVNSPGSTGTTIETPQSKIEWTLAALKKDSDLLPRSLKSSALAVVHDGATNSTQVFNLTLQPIKISNIDGTQFKTLQAGQTATIRNGVIGDVKTFDLGKFYRTSKLAEGLGPEQEALVKQESQPVQEILNAVRQETITAWKSQKKWVEGLCNLNSRGSASTLSTNCITTDTDNPLNVREVVTPPRTITPPQRQENDGGTVINPGGNNNQTPVTTPIPINNNSNQVSP